MEDDRAPLPRPKLPQRGSRQPPQRNATFLALAGLLSAAIGLAVLITAVLTGFAPAAIVVILLIMGAVAFLFGGHYLIWGIWLDRVHASRGQSAPIEFWKQAHLPPAPTVVPDTETEG
jgi:fatty acid desaturase